MWFWLKERSCCCNVAARLCEGSSQLSGQRSACSLELAVSQAAYVLMEHQSSATKKLAGGQLQLPHLYNLRVIENIQTSTLKDVLKGCHLGAVRPRPRPLLCSSSSSSSSRRLRCPRLGWPPLPFTPAPPRAGRSLPCPLPLPVPPPSRPPLPACPRMSS